MKRFNKNILILILGVVIATALGHYLFEYASPWLGVTSHLTGFYLIIKSIINLIKERRNEKD